MSSLEDIFKRLNSWKISESKILVHWTSGSPQSMFSFVGYIADADEPEVRLVGEDEKSDTLATFSLSEATSLELAERPARVHAFFLNGNLFLGIDPTESKQYV